MKIFIMTFILAVAALTAIECQSECDPCPTNCQFGTSQIIDNDGCKCVCSEDPCKRLKCQNGTTCIIKKCARENKCKLYMRASCVPNNKKGNCPIAEYIVEKNATSCVSDSDCDHSLKCCTSASTQKVCAKMCPDIKCNCPRDMVVVGAINKKGCSVCTCTSQSSSNPSKDVLKYKISEKCQLPMEIGPCKGIVKRFFYNQTSQQCEKFNYGGCKGNLNNFNSIEQCNQNCNLSAKLVEKKQKEEDVCSLERDIGPCKAAVKRFFYNSTSQECQRFTYGGCKGNKNNFLKMEDCNRKCVTQVKNEVKSKVSNNCSLRVDSGPCYAFFDRYFYNATSGKCENFVYGGCQGNGNNFASSDECEKTCGRGVVENSIKEPPVNKCSLDIQPGRCRGYFPRYFFNKTSQTCEKFIYGGCDGNANNFEKIEDCSRQCGSNLTSTSLSISKCSLDSAPGPCRGYFPRFFFNKTSQACELFIYGGCEGNENNFEQMSDCIQNCSATETNSSNSNVDNNNIFNKGNCRLFPPTTGISCMAYLERYFYNSTSNQCEMFIYGGCGGNGNNFLTEEACQKGCGQK